MSEDKSLSPVEGIKDASRYLRGTIADELKADTTHFGKGDIQLLKFHGTYQQDDRETRVKKADGGKSDKSFSFMVRSRIPGGVLTAAQLVAHLDICDQLGNSTLKVTTRQGLQLHGIVKSDLWSTIHKINEIQLSTLSACGDVNRNVMCCPAPYSDGVHAEMQKLAYDLAMHLAPRSKAYYEIWVQDPESDDKQLVAGAPEEEDYEPIYGKVYLPRKFKTAVCLPDDNCVDIYTNDLGFLAVVRDGKIIGYNVVVGGGLGTTPANKKTFPALAHRMAFCTPEQAIGVAEAVVKVQRDFGNRADRKTARLKYLIADRGIQWYRDQVESYFGQKLPDCMPDEVTGVNEHMGWEAQGDGRWFYGMNVENGRLFDDERRQWKAAIREICTTLNPDIRLTAQQSIMFINLAESDRATLDHILKKHGIPLPEDYSIARKLSMACVALPTCSLAITESERVMPNLMDRLDTELARLGLAKERFTVRMTGCPNGCARPYNADIAFVGKAKDKYTLFLGGRLEGNRLAFIHKDLVPFDDLVPSLVPLFMAFREHRETNESFGDFCDRQGNEKLLSWASQFSEATAG